MVMRRTTVFVDEADLAVIKAAAAADGVSEAEIIRGAIRLAAMSRRRWSEPFFTFSAPRVADVTADEVFDEMTAEHVTDRESRRAAKPRPA